MNSEFGTPTQTPSADLAAPFVLDPPLDDPPGDPAPQPAAARTKPGINGADFTRLSEHLQTTAALAHERINKLHQKTRQIHADVQALSDRIRQMRTQVQQVCSKAKKWPFQP